MDGAGLHERKQVACRLRLCGTKIITHHLDVCRASTPPRTCRACRSEFLSRFVPPPSPSMPSCVGSLVERMACRLLVFFVRHAALLRPLSQAGKLLVR